jgi:predicted N-formylglutamate amidohydrolase
VAAGVPPAGLVLTCEHASNAVPPGVDLGVSAEVLASHCAWDHGTREIAVGLAARFGAPLHLGVWTRMYVDLNRFAHNPKVIPENAFGEPVPGNVGLSEAERKHRLDEVHAPWRAAAQASMAHMLAAHGRCVHLSVHSFTPRLGDEVRDYDMGILYDPDRPADVEAADILVKGLQRSGLSVRRNEPYLGTGDGLTTASRERFGAAWYAGIEVETSHRVTEAPGGVDRVVAALISALS